MIDTRLDVSAIKEAIELGRKAPDVLLPYELPEKLIFRPAEEQLKCLGAVNHLGTSKVVATVDTTDTYTGFEGRRVIFECKWHVDGYHGKAESW